MDELRRSSHAVYDLKYHLVWVPKYRRRNLISQIAERLEEIFLEIAEEYDFEIIEQKVRNYHVHLFVSAPPRYSASQLVNMIKSISARQIFQEFPWFRKKCWNEKLWQDGYFVRGVGNKLTSEVIARYIRYQEKEGAGKQLTLFEKIDSKQTSKKPHRLR